MKSRGNDRQAAPKSGSSRPGARLFALTTLGLAATIGVLGWLTGLGRALRALLLALTTIAFLPFLAVAGCLLLFVVIGLLGVIVGDDASDGILSRPGDAVGSATWWKTLFVGYYGFLFRQRHPVPLGIAAGLVLGTLAVFGELSMFVLPREACTLERLMLAKRGIDQYYGERGHYPPSNERSLSPSLLGVENAATQSACGQSWDSRVLLDAFGRPVVYERDQAPARLGAYRLVSLGFDGRPSDDDLCVSGATRARLALDRALAIVDVLASLETLLAHGPDRPAESSWRPWWSALRLVDCRP